ncbi:DUF4240 domain-containing protein [Micromonospora sp. NPDC023644]|uniref:DUF4240 domain-containing protein n=1 Tax=Micromonospora sp. NPDC023644 TaxID=3154321 RepID=UPI0033CE7B67
MDVDRFWHIVERARESAGPAADRARQGGPSAVAEALVVELTRLPLPEIVAFDQTLGDLCALADTGDIVAACWIIEHGFLSDDRFSDFRAGLIGLGRGAFEAVLTEPDTLAGHPAVQEVSASHGHNLWIGDEALLFAAPEAYERRTGDPDAFWDAAEVDTARPTRAPRRSDEERWDLRDEDEWRRRLPELAALFLAHRFTRR